MAYDDNNIFARVLRVEIPTDPVYEDDCVDLLIQTEKETFMGGAL